MLITGAGGPGSEALARNWNHHEVFFADVDIQRIHPSIPRGRCRKIPSGKDPNFYRDIGLFISELGIEVVVSQVDEELELLNQLRREIGTFDLITPDSNFVRMCNNKAELGENLRKNGILEPNTELLSHHTKLRPSNMIFKPSYGRGSRGIFIFRHDCHFESLKSYLLSTNVPYIVQDEIAGEEFTVQVMANRSGKLKAIVPVQVFEKRGSTINCKINLNHTVLDTTRLLHNSFNPIGTYNVQSILDTQSGENYIIEINPRVSTTLCLSLEAGLDPIELFFDDTETFHSTKKQLTLNRHWTNFFSGSK